MSIYTSITISRAKATEIILKAIAEGGNEALRELADHILRKGDRYNIWRVVDGVEDTDDHLV